MKKLIAFIDRPITIRAALQRLFYIELAATLVLGGLDLVIWLGNGPVVGSPFVPAAWCAVCTVLTGLLLYGTRHMSDADFDTAARAFAEDSPRHSKFEKSTRVNAPDGTSD